MQLVEYLVLAGVIFSIGFYGVLTRRNAVSILLGIELMLNAVNLNLVAFSSFIKPLVGQVFVVFNMAIAAGEAAIGLAIILAVYRVHKTVDLSKINRLKG